MIDENLLFIILITVFSVFIINKQPKLIATISLIIILYYFYKLKFTNTKEFFTFIKTKIKEGFEPCSSNNIGYCDNDGSASNITFLPDIMRRGIPSNNINNNSIIKLKKEDFIIDKRLQLGKEEISIDTIIREVPLLIDYKLYQENVINFVMNLKNDDTIQKTFLCKKIKYIMTKIFYNAYNTVINRKYNINTYNELLLSQREFNDTLNIVTLLGFSENSTNDDNKILELQKEFKTMNDKLNEYIIEKVNAIKPIDYNITTSFLPQKNEPQGIIYLEDTDYSNYMGL
jgi:hypothetical protein